MSRERFEDLKEAYALDALPEEERREFEQYLAENPSERSEVEELSSIAALLALAPQEQEPPAGLRRSLMNQVYSEARDAESAGTSRSERASREGWARRIFGARGFAAAAVAAMLAGLVVWNVSLQSQVQGQQDQGAPKMSTYELQGSGQAKSVKGKVVKIGDQGAMLVATNLPELPRDKTYEMWTINGDKPRACGVFKPQTGPAIQTTKRPISGADKFAITVEPKGGSKQPTTDPIVLADLTNNS